MLRSYLLVYLLGFFLAGAVIADTYPLQNTGLGITQQNVNYNYNAGYRFTANVDGNIISLGGRWATGVSHTVRLYSYPSGTLLASATILGTDNWKYSTLGTSVSVSQGDQFVVAVRLDNQNSGMNTLSVSYPQSSGGITIEGTSYKTNSNNMPTNIFTDQMIGHADIKFQPCSYAGDIDALEYEITSGESTTLSVANNVGNIQWQSSPDGNTFSDISGATGSVLNTGPLNSSTYFRTLITGGACVLDTSNSIVIAVNEPFYPWQNQNEALSSQDNNWKYSMGYRFTALQNGDVTELGGRWTTGITHTVSLYEYPAGTLLASVSMVGDINWNYAAITPVTLSQGSQYVVAVYLDRQNSGCSSAPVAFPITSGGIQIDNSCYKSGAAGMPTNVVLDEMFGQADLRFSPCSYAGTIVAQDENLIRFDSTSLECISNIGSIQWQRSFDNISYIDISGETDSILNSGPLSQTTYFRTYVTDGLCNPRDTAEPVSVIVSDPLRPWQSMNVDQTNVGLSYNYNMGYKFTPRVTGSITELGGRWKTGDVKTVRVYDFATGTLLGSANVTGRWSWSYTTLGTPINLNAGTAYVVAVKMNGAGDGGTTVQSFPFSFGQIDVESSCYISNSTNMPNTCNTSLMYGEADFKFVPCVYAGLLDVTDPYICSGSSTTIEVNEYVGAVLQWQSSTNKINFSNIPGATDSVLNTGSLTQSTYFRAIVSDVCGSDTSVVDSVLVLGSGGTRRTWTALLDDDWNNACNWLEGVLPSNGDSVFITGNMAPPILIPEIRLSYLKLNILGGIKLVNKMTIANSIDLTVGNLDLGSDTLVLESNVSIVGGYSTSYIVADRGGYLIKEYSIANGSGLVLPVGDSLNFSPLTLQLNPGSNLAANAYIAIRIDDIAHPLMGSPNNYIKRYWQVRSYDITNIDYSIYVNYRVQDVVGTEININGYFYDSIGGWFQYAAVNDVDHSISFANITAVGDFSGSDETPILSSASGDWSNGATWLGGIVPGATDDAVIRNTHTVGLTSNTTCEGFNIALGGKLDLNNFELEILENLTLFGSTDSSGLFTFTGSQTQFLIGDTATIFAIQVDNLQGVQIYSGIWFLLDYLRVISGDFNSGGKMVLHSDLVSNARILELTGGASVSGAFTFQRYIPDGPLGFGDWQQVGLPLDVVLEDFDDDVFTTGFPGTDYSNPNYWISMYTYDETDTGSANYGWTVPSSTSDALTSGKGLWLYQFQSGGITYDFKGEITQGDHDFGATYSDDGVNPASEHGWMLVGNPYPCPIDWETGWTRSNMSSTIYMWNPNQANYATYTLGGASTFGGSRYIAPGQGFWVKASASSPQLMISESSKVDGYYDYIRLGNGSEVLNLSLNGISLHDELVFVFDDLGELGVDENHDAYKISSLNPSVPYLAAVIQDTLDLVVNHYPKLNESYSIPIRVKTSIAGNFTLSSSNIADFENYACLVLEDIHLDSLVDFKSLPDGYDFYLYDSTQAPRFIMHFGSADSSVYHSSTCYGTPDAGIEVRGNGWGPWDYTLKDMAGANVQQFLAQNGAASFTGLNAGSYVLQISNDTSVCSDINDTIVLVMADSMHLIIDSIVSPLCYGDSNGAVALSSYGGTGNVSFLWPDGASDSLRDNLSSGNYALTLTDGNSCQESKLLSIPLVDSISVNGIVTDVSCYGLFDASIDVNVSGGTGIFNLLWNTGDTSLNLNSLSAGGYNLTASDQNMCQKIWNITVSEPDSINIQDSIVEISCTGNSDGQIFITASGGSPAYTYLWSNGLTSQNLQNLSSGNYQLSITDQNGCLKVKNMPLNNLPGLSIAYSITDLSCYGAMDGSIDVNINGGTPPFTYLWSDGDTVASRMGLPSDGFDLVVTDANFCADTIENLLVGQPGEIIASFVMPDTIYLNANPSLQINNTSVGGGLYHWDFGDGTGFIALHPFHTYANPGVYMVQLIASDGNCQDTATKEIVVMEKSPVLTLGQQNYVNQQSMDIRAYFYDDQIILQGQQLKGKIASISVYNNLGQIQMHKERIMLSQNQWIENTNAWVAGVYFMHADIAGNKQILKFVIED